MTTQLSPLAIQHFTDNNGNLLAGGQLYTYAAGTSTPLATYTDSTGGTPNTNPVIMNARGEANVWTTSGLSYKFVLKDASGVAIWTVDNITDGSLNSALAAALASTSNLAQGVALVGGASRVVASIAALRTLPKTGSPEVFVTGYYVQGDGGGGAYWYDSTDTTTADNGGTVIVASDGGRWKLALTSSASVKQFGARGDGVTDDHAAIVASIAAAAIGGGTVYWPAGLYLCNSPFTVPNNIRLVGAGMRITTIKRNFTGDFITAFGGYSSMEDLTLEGNTASNGLGRGVIFAPVSPSSYFLNVEIQNFSQSCVVLPADCGATFKATACNFYTTGAAGVIAAIACTGIDSAATSRHFTDCESGGCTLFDFSGSNDTYVTGGYTRDFITDANTSKLLMVNMRVANISPLTINGSSCRFSNSVFAGLVTLSCINSYFHCEVPSYAITDNGTGNDVFQDGVSYAAAWTSSGTAPALGNGSITATYSRTGSLIDVLFDVTLGSTSTVGTGNWFFSLPRADYASLVQMCGSGLAVNGAGTSSATFVVRVEPGSQKASMFYVDTAGALQNVGAVKPAATWNAGSTLRFSLRYYTT